MIRNFIICGIAILLAVGKQSFAQPSGLLFHHLGNLNENGINFVNDILFDSQDRVWLGGQTGFYRYDGEHYFAYRNTKDSNSIPDNFVHVLCEDKQGNIWGGTEAGIFRFNPGSQEVKRYLTPDAFSDQGVNNISCDVNGKLWAATAYHILLYNNRLDSFELCLDITKASINNSPIDIRKRGMLPSPDGKYLWLATRQGLWAYHIAANALLNPATQPQNPFFAYTNTSALAEGQLGQFLFFDNTRKEVIKFDPIGMKVVKRISVAETLPDASGATLFEAKDGSIWFCSWSNQVLMIDQQDNNRIYDINGRLNEPPSLLSNYFWQARQDKDGSIWLATPEGIFVYNKPKDLFKIYRLSKQIQELKPHVFINVFAENPADTTWWMTTSGNNSVYFLPSNQTKNQEKKSTTAQTVIHYNSQTAGYEVLDLNQAPPNRQGLKPSSNNFICFYKNKPVFITNNGAWMYHSTLKRWQTLETASGISFPFIVRMMAADGQKGYYISDGQQLGYFQDDAKEVKMIVLQNATNIRPGYSLYPRQSNKPQLYGSNGLSGIIKLDPNLSHMTPLLENSRIENIGYIDDMDVDSKGRVWVSFKNVGLFMFDPDTGKIRQWDESDGLAINGIHNLTIDHMDNIWTLHRRQFSVLLAGTDRFFNVAMPITNTILNWSNNLVTLRNGHVVANNFSDIVEFFPNRLLQQPVSRFPEISAMYVNQKPRIFGTGDIMQLSPDENSIQFSFGILTNKIFFPYDLEYILEGVEKSWQKAGSNAEAFYNKLPAGSYIFKVRAVAKNGTWTSGERHLYLKISQPVYQQAWFISAMLLLAAAIAYMVVRYRLLKQKQVFQLETKSAVLEREKATIQYDSLKQQLNPHFLFNSLTSLAGLIEANQQLAGKFLQRMSDMYRYILKNGEQETVALIDEIKFAHLYVDIQQTRFGSGIQMEVDVPDEYMSYRIAPVTLQNLIENAIKHNIIDEESPLIVSIYIEREYIVVSNNLQRKNKVETSNRTGLKQFISLYKFLSDKPVVVEEVAEKFIVKIPLL